MQSYLYNLYINSMVKYLYILYQEWASKNCRVMLSGLQKFLQRDEWAMKKIPAKSRRNPVPLPVINNDRSLR